VKAICEVPERDKCSVKSWAKLLTKIDFGQKGGYMFEGKFIGVGHQEYVPVGSIILTVDYITEDQSVPPKTANPKADKALFDLILGTCVPYAKLYKVVADGELVLQSEMHSKRWARAMARVASKHLKQCDDSLDKLEYSIRTIGRILTERPELMLSVTIAFGKMGITFNAD